MQLNTQGQVTINQQSPNQKFKAFVAEAIQNWLLAHDMSTLNTEYDISFFNEDAIDEVSCLITIQSGSHFYRAWETADTESIALIRSLDRLQIDFNYPTEH